MKNLKNKLSKIVIILVMLSSTITFGQKLKWNQKDPAVYAYSNFSFDANMAFGIKDNDDTMKPDRGFDWDMEVGARDRHVGVYLFYGRFDAFNYQNYGAGVDYYVNWFRENNIELSVGVAYSKLIREDIDGNHGSFGWYHVRGVATWWILDDVGITGRLQYQQRGDLPDKHGTIEGSIGVTLKLDLFR